MRLAFSGLLQWLKRLLRRDEGVQSAMTTAYGHNVHLTFFRYGEVSVLFRWVGSGPAPKEPVLDPDQLRVAFNAAGVQVSMDHDPFLRAGGKERRVAVSFTGDDGGDYLFQTVNLAAWAPDLEARNDQNAHNAGLDLAIRAVPTAVAALNDGVAAGRPQDRLPIRVDDWELVTASPNWRVLPFCVPDNGGPGGRPIKAKVVKRFRPSGRPNNVRAAVEACIPGRVSDSDELRGRTRVAVLDSWPMENQEGLCCGGTPDRPLEKIRQFLDDHPEAHANYFLHAAARGDLVRPDRIFDYVSCEPCTIPACHFNWERGDRGEVEPPYDMSDHGLFIAGLIKDIAPDAEISIYRVLDNEGTGELHSIVHALRDAIDHAGGDPLVINMSLGFAPPLLMIKRLLNPTNGGQNAVDCQDAGLWAEELATCEVSADTVATTLKGQGLLKIGERQKNGRTVGNFKLDGPLAMVQYLFSLPHHQNVFVIAAAGNDSRGAKLRFPPRLPAFVEGVLGVSAQEADYSNRDDIERLRDDGVAAFGGKAVHDAASGTTLTKEREGMVGIAITRDLPPPNDRAAVAASVNNDDGWAEWAGTSFAAPVAAGLAACIWAKMGTTFTTSEMMTAIVGPLDPSPRREINLRQEKA